MTNAQRQQSLRNRRIEAGLVQVNVWVPVGAVADIQRAAELLRAEPELTVARLMDKRTGKLRGLRKAQ